MAAHHVHNTVLTGALQFIFLTTCKERHLWQVFWTVLLFPLLTFTLLILLPSRQAWAGPGLAPVISLLLFHGRAPATSLSVGANHNCVVLEDGKIACWGYNLWGQLGNGTVTFSSFPKDVSGISTSTAIAAGVRHGCTVLAGKTAKCWGDNGYGQLGNNTHGTGTGSTIPVAVQGISAGKLVTTGDNFSCILLMDGTVQCWGRGSDGQLGNNASGALADRDVPQSVVLADYTGGSVTVGGFHACMVDNYSLLIAPVGRCWGRNTSGQLGIGTNTAVSIPTKVKNSAGSGSLFGVSTISAGDNHTCASLSTGQVFCWGWNGSGQIGQPANSPSSKNLPVQVGSFGAAGSPDALAVSAGGDHSCALTDDGRVWCWGNNIYGQLGRGSSLVAGHTPVAVTGINTAIALGTGYFHSCALLTDRSVRCWGRNNHGQLGVETPGMSFVPVKVSGLTEQP